MSDLVFPKLRGEGWNVGRSIIFKNRVSESVSGHEIRVSSQHQPRWRFKIKYNFMRQQETAFNEFAEIRDFYLAHQGQYESFLYRDPNNFAVVDSLIGVSDGVKTQYKLVLDRKGFKEEVAAVNLSSEVDILLDSVPLSPTAYTVLSSGELEFETAPAVNVVITATFEYLYRVRFSRDEQNFDEFLYKLHRGDAVLISVLGE